MFKTNIFCKTCSSPLPKRRKIAIEDPDVYYEQTLVTENVFCVNCTEILDPDVSARSGVDYWSKYIQLIKGNVCALNQFTQNDHFTFLEKFDGILRFIPEESIQEMKYKSLICMGLEQPPAEADEELMHPYNLDVQKLLLPRFFCCEHTLLAATPRDLLDEKTVCHLCPIRERIVEYPEIVRYDIQKAQDANKGSLKFYNYREWLTFGKNHPEYFTISENQEFKTILKGFVQEIQTLTYVENYSAIQTNSRDFAIDDYTFTDKACQRLTREIFSYLKREHFKNEMFHRENLFDILMPPVEIFHQKFGDFSFFTRLLRPSVLAMSLDNVEDFDGILYFRQSGRIINKYLNLKVLRRSSPFWSCYDEEEQLYHYENDCKYWLKDTRRQSFTIVIYRRVSYKNIDRAFQQTLNIVEQHFRDTQREENPLMILAVQTNLTKNTSLDVLTQHHADEENDSYIMPYYIHVCYTKPVSPVTVYSQCATMHVNISKELKVQMPWQLLTMEKHHIMDMIMVSQDIEYDVKFLVMVPRFAQRVVQMSNQIQNNNKRMSRMMKRMEWRDILASALHLKVLMLPVAETVPKKE